MLLAVWLAGVLSCAGTVCPAEVPPPPGEAGMGSYAVHAAPLTQACGLEDVTTAPFDFDVILSTTPDAGLYFLTLSGGYSREASWDGQVLTARASSRRYFRQCAACVTQLEETIEVSLLSESQAAAVGYACPADALDGGVPSPDDAGIRPPGPREQGFDAILACGELRTRVLVEAGGDEGCPDICRTCETSYVLTGERR